MLNVSKFEVTPFQQNARILWCSETKSAVLVDPGGDAEILMRALKDKGLALDQIWLTHSHLDHCGGVAGIKALASCVLCAHQVEAGMRANVDRMCEMFGVPPGVMENCPEPERYLVQGDTLELGKLSFEVLFAPGHSPGHLCFYCKEAETVLTGDVLFRGSIGRTDLPGGSSEELIRSIKEQLLTLPDQTRVLSGHGPDSTIGIERRSNPYLSGEQHGWF